MLTRKVQKTHETLTVSIPRQFCAMVGIEKGTVMRIDYRDEKIVMTPMPASQQANTSTGAVAQPMEAMQHD